MSSFRRTEGTRKRMAVNPQFEMREGYGDMDIPLGGSSEVGPTSTEGRTTTAFASYEDYRDDPEYDTAMAELLQQLPSRQIDGIAEAVSRTLRAKRKSHRTSVKFQREGKLEDDIVQTLRKELDEESDLDDIDSAVRTMPTNLSQKRNIFHALSLKKERRVSRWQSTKYAIAMNWQHFKHEVQKVFRLFDLWRSHLMAIEGQFGTSVLSYFIFLKWVLLINIPIFLLTFFFLVIPQILYRWYQKEPSGYEDHAATFTGIELLTGDGFFENTEMYYGFYTNETVHISHATYMMKYAYLFTCGGYYVMCLIILGYSYLHSYRKYYIEASGQMSLYYFTLVLCGWDYGIRSSEAALLKQKSIYNEFKEYLSGVRTEGKKLNRDEIAKKWLFRILAWLVVINLWAGSGYATYVVSMELSIKPQLANETSIPVVSTLAMPVVLSTIQLFIPMIFTFLEAHEEFTKPKYELYVHMFRDMALKATMLGVLVFFWFTTASKEVKCWETFVGQEIYRLVIMDLIFSLGYSFFMEYVRRLLSYKWKSIERSEFAIGRHTLELVYSQALCWLGVFYSPLLPVVVIIKLVLMFYIKRYSLTSNCKPSVKPWRASRTHTIFVGYLFLFFILVFVAVGCSIILIKPSSSCGPYMQYDVPFDVVNNLIDEWKGEHEVLAKIFGFVNSPGFGAGILIFLCMVMFFIRTIMLSHKEMVDMFKLQLASEGKDKKFLINLLNQVKLRGRRVSKHQGPAVAKTRQDLVPISQDRNGGRGHVFVRAVAETVIPGAQ